MSNKITKNEQINGTNYKVITKSENGEIIWQKNCPIVPFGVPASGLHTIQDHPEQDHWDHIKGHEKWKEYLTKNPVIYQV